ncbi:MAG: radical SAM protein [Magnetococcales bacterium]|nr:radical SAM protein [Magnetococcales bacterium]
MNDITEYGISLTKFLFKKNLRHLILHVTNNCNFRCSHCFVDFTRKKDLTLEQYQTIARDCGPIFWLDIGGGEPFLRKDLAKIIASFKASVVGIPTNGSLLEQTVEQIKQLKSLVGSELIVGFSLDGLAATNDRIRKQEGNWDQVWETFAALRQLGGVSLKITTVLCNQNMEEIIPLMKEVQSRKPDFHSVILVRGNPMDPDVTLPPVDELRRLGPEIFEILQKYDYGKGRLSSTILKNYHRFLWQTTLRTLEEKRQIIPCLGGSAHSVVWGDGRVSSCEMLEEVGNINETSFKEILQSDGYKNQLQFIKDKKCHCTHNCAMLDSIFFNPACISRLFFPVEI